MRIAIDGGAWENARGYGRYTRELVAALGRVNTTHDLLLVLPRTARPDSVPEGVRAVFADTIESPARAARADGSRSLRDVWTMHRALARDRPNIVFFPTVYTFVPVAPGSRVVTTIHDVIPERYPHLVFPNRRSRWLWTMKQRLALAQSARVVTVSEHARDGIVDRLGVAPAAVRVVDEAPAPVFQRTTDASRVAAARRAAEVEPGSRLLVYVGGIAPHKNLKSLVDVFIDLVQCRSLSDVTLLLIGDYHDRVFFSAYPALRAYVDARGCSAVRFAGYLPDSTVAALLSDAVALVLPSLDEGLGLPGLEAAACGTAVIATRSSGLPEILGDAPIFVEPTSTHDLRSALDHLLADPQASVALGRRAAQKVEGLTWNRSAEQLLDVFAELGH